MERLALAIEPPVNTVDEIEKVVPLTRSPRKGVEHQRPVPGGYNAVLHLPDRSERPAGPGSHADHPDRCRDRTLYRDDGKLAGRGPAFSRAGIGPSLSGQGIDARDDRNVRPIAATVHAPVLSGDPGQTFSRQEFEQQLEYLKRTPQVRDVLLSGGDPLVLAPKILEEILTRLSEIPHIEIVRIGSRVPVFMPMRITQELCDMLGKYPSVVVEHPCQPPE